MAHMNNSSEIYSHLETLLYLLISNANLNQKMLNVINVSLAKTKEPW
jgi:hypothetical protein